MKSVTWWMSVINHTTIHATASGFLLILSSGTRFDEHDAPHNQARYCIRISFS
jgi:hypothetical protein